MTVLLTRKKIRIAADATSKDAIVDVNTNESPYMWRGTLAQIEVGLFQGDDLVDDLTGIESITVEIRDINNKAGIAYVSKTVEAASFDDTVDAAAWTAGTKQHAIVELDEDDTDLAVANDSRNYWLVISAVLTDGPITVAAGLIQVLEDGANSLAGSGAYYTPSQSDARYMRRAMDNASFRTDANGQHIQLWDPDLELWRTLIIQNGTLSLSAGEE